MRRIFVLFCLLAAVSLPASAVTSTRQSQDREIRSEFFIVSEVSLPKQQLVLELPTQSTLVMHFNRKTTFLNRSGRQVPMTEIHAGDTVYVTYLKTDKGSLALKIRSGAMTVRILHQRYWTS